MAQPKMKINIKNEDIAPKMEPTTTEKEIDERIWRLQMIVNDHNARREGLIKAITTDYDKLYAACDPTLNKNLFLFGVSSHKWKLAEPSGIPSTLFEGINKSRDSLGCEWISNVAKISETWSIIETMMTAKGFKFDSQDMLYILNNILVEPSIVQNVCKQDSAASVCGSTSDMSYTFTPIVERAVPVSGVGSTSDMSYTMTPVERTVPVSFVGSTSDMCQD